MPFGMLMKALVNLADLSIGVPTGPYHLSMVKPELPTVGLWMQHMPSWYDEPKEAAVHLLSRNIAEAGLDKRSGSFIETPGLTFRTRTLETRIITGQQVLEAVETLLY